MAPVLRTFQQEIDRLGQRSKAAEVAFLGVYKKVIDVAGKSHATTFLLGRLVTRRRRDDSRDNRDDDDDGRHDDDDDDDESILSLLLVRRLHIYIHI